MSYTNGLDDPSAYFRVKLFTGNSSTQSITFDETDTNMQPDLVWIKNRDHANHNVLFDAVRGTSKILYANLTHAEATATGVTAFDSNGFTLGNDSDTNRDTNSHVSWNWKANGSGSANTTGDIDSTVSVNTDAGFSIIEYEGSGTNGDDVGHGIGATPSVILLKQYSQVSGWRVYHSSIHASSGEDKTLSLQSADANSTDIDTISGVSSTVFTLKDTNGNGATNNSGGDFIAYAWTPVQGFSKFGSYTGTGNADGPYVHCGFRPAFILGKNATQSSQHWFMVDNKRSPYNGDSRWLKADGSDAELTNLVNPDFLSNGFKIRNSNDIYNDSGETFIYIAFAEAPFVNSNGVPCNAR